MAIWQYSFTLVVDNNLDLASLKHDMSSLFGVIFDESNDHVDFGTYEGNRCTIFLSGNKIKEILCRIDLRIFNQGKYETFLKLIEKMKLKIKTSDDKIIGSEGLLEELKNSHAFKFVIDPENFFKGVLVNNKNI